MINMPSSENIRLPENIEILEFIGSGGRARVYSAMIDECNAVVKVYHKEVAKKYRDKYKVDIAEYEHSRNQSLYSLNEIQGYIAKPIQYFPASGQFTHCIVQQRVYGESLENLIKRLGYLPDVILEAGRNIVHVAEKNNIHDLDISVGNLKIDKSSGIWKPRLYDFNIMPQYMFPPNPMVGLGYKLGIRKKSFRDYRSLRNWDRRGKQKKWIGRN
jgi:serine/threonine protein kinase